MVCSLFYADGRRDGRMYMFCTFLRICAGEDLLDW